MATPVKFSNISATTSAFQLGGGWYTVACIGSSFGTVTLQILGPDGSTYMTALTAFSANGISTVQLPPGQYKVAITTTTGVYFSITPINVSQP